MRQTPTAIGGTSCGGYLPVHTENPADGALNHAGSPDPETPPPHGTHTWFIPHSTRPTFRWPPRVRGPQPGSRELASVGNLATPPVVARHHRKDYPANRRPGDPCRYLCHQRKALGYLGNASAFLLGEHHPRATSGAIRAGEDMGDWDGSPIANMSLEWIILAAGTEAGGLQTVLIRFMPGQRVPTWRRGRGLQCVDARGLAWVWVAVVLGLILGSLAAGSLRCRPWPSRPVSLDDSQLAAPGWAWVSHVMGSSCRWR